MQKNKSIMIMAPILCVGAVASMFLLSTNSNLYLFAHADAEPYTLTIDSSNKSNFVQDGDVYRGTFKTALGNDIVFRTVKVSS